MRVQYQEHLLEIYENTVVSFKLNIPGPVKYSPLIKRIFDEGVAAFKEKLKEVNYGLIYDTASYKVSGPDYFAVLDEDSAKIKKLTIAIEESHRLGRIFDFDVINAEGSQVSREELGSSLRKCLLCENNAFHCSRSRTHEVVELIEHIEALALNYFGVLEEEIQ